jgi:ATP-dependent DNA helicase DinG
VREVCEAADGRTLGLFTSYKTLNASYEELGGFRHRVFKQGEAPRTLIAKKFREDVHSVLLGTESFWAGVDVPGESLSCVIIDRLPFPTPDDPIVDAISEKNDRWFFEYAIPRAVIQFKQGFGRLIRTTEDRGVVVVLDRRILTKSYGRSFIKALPPVMMADAVADVRTFLEGAASEVG